MSWLVNDKRTKWQKFRDWVVFFWIPVLTVVGGIFAAGVFVGRYIF